MAVEIPVYIDIKGAIDQASKQLPNGIKELQSVVNKNTLHLEFDVTGGRKMDLQEMLLGGDTSMSDLKRGLRSIREEFDKMSQAAIIDKNPKNRLKNIQQIRELARAYGLVEQRITGVANTNTVAAMMVQNNINKVKAKLAELQATLATQTKGSEAYNQTNYAIKIQQQRLAELTKQQLAYKAGVDQSNSSMTRQHSILTKLVAQFGIYLSVHSLIRFVKQIRDVTGELEYQRVALGHLIQDVDKGNELFGRLVEAAKESPFRIKDLVTYTKQLAAYRIEEDELFDTTMKLADISAGLGVSMDRLILAYGQVRAASVLRGQELRQFTEAGIPLVDELAKKFTKLKGTMVSTADVFKLISQRAVPFEYIKEIFEELTEAGGMFYKMQEEQAKTLQGRWEKLKDAYDKALMSLGENDTFQKWNDTILKALNGIANNLTGIVRVANAAAIAWITYKAAASIAATTSFKLTKALTKEYGITGLLTAAVNGLTVAWKKFTVWVNSNWVGLALSAVATLITYFTTFRKKTEDASKELSDMEKTIEGMKRANKDLEYGKELISSYEELASKSERTASESERLRLVMEELKVLYPDIADSIDAENRSLEEQIRLLNGAAEANHNYAVEEAQKMLGTQKQVIRGLEEEAAAAKIAYEAALRRQEQAEAAEAAGPRTTGGYYTKSAKELKEETIKAANEASRLQQEYETAAMNLANAKKQAEELEKVINPGEKTKDWQQWAKEIKSIQDSMVELGVAPVFTDEELQGFTMVSDMADKLKKKIEDLTESLQGMQSLYDGMADKGSEAAQALDDEIKKTQKTLDIAEAIRAALGLIFKKTGGSDTRLSDLKKDISELTNAYKKYLELRKYMSEEAALNEIDLLFPQLKGWTPTFEETISRLEEMREEIAEKLRRSPKDKTLLEMQRAIDTEISNLKFDALKKKVDSELKRLSDELKQSEAAKKFYDSILETTGDKDLAATMSLAVYGETGDDLKDKIQQSLKTSFVLDDAKVDAAGLDLSGVREAIDEAISNQDTKALRKYLEYVVEDNQKAAEDVIATWEKEEVDFIEGLYKTYQKAKTYEERVTDIRKKEAEARSKIAEDRALTPDQKESFTAASFKKEANEVAKVELEAMKDTYTWTKAFEDLEGVSTLTLNNLIDLIDEYVDKYAKDLEPQQLKELIRAREQAEAQKNQRNAYRAMGAAVGKLTNKTRAYEILQENSFNLTKASAVIADEQKKALKDLADAYNEAEAEINEYISSLKNLMSVFATSDDASYFGEQLDNLSKTISGIGKAGAGIAQLATGAITPQAIMQTATGLADVVSSIFGAANAAQTRKVTKEIDYQNRLVEDLEESYDNLSRAMDRAFGNDYVYNYSQQLENLIAQQEAYQKQVDTLNDASSSAKTKKKKEEFREQAQEAEKEVRKVGTAIDDLKNTASSFFAGSDLASAAESFADAWLSAYQEFGDTAGAIEERMTEMVQNIMKKAALSGIAESVLGGWYESLADVRDWNAQTIAEKWREAMALVDPMVQGMQTFANSMQAEGMNLRQLPGQFTGIKRDIAGASEESINGLAAGINTQNFYMSYISQNVAAILAYLTGGAVTPASTATGAASDPYKDTVLLNLSSLPQMRDDLYEIRRLLSNVIKPTGTTATHYVATNL